MKVGAPGSYVLMLKSMGSNQAGSATKNALIGATSNESHVLSILTVYAPQKLDFRSLMVDCGLSSMV